MVTAHRLILLVLVFAVALNAPLFGWDNVGHMAVAYVVYQHLNAATKARVDTLLQLNPDYPKWKSAIPSGTSAARTKMMVFMMAATWPDAIRSKPGYTDDGSEGGNRPDGATSVQNIGYSDHLHHKYWHFVGHSVLNGWHGAAFTSKSKCRDWRGEPQGLNKSSWFWLLCLFSL